MAEAPKPGTLRLAADLNGALTKAAKGAGISATKLADTLLREGLGMEVSRSQLAADRDRKTKVRQVGAPPCPHPIGRRIGSGCAACGATSVKS